jgi:hypothetical protein
MGKTKGRTLEHAELEHVHPPSLYLMPKLNQSHIKHSLPAKLEQLK